LRIYADNPLTIGEMGIGYEDTKQAEALREALVNLLTHTDYFSPMKPRIRVFTNRIEFENPGMLPRPVEELIKADESLPRNPVLAKFFRIAKLCESAGFGFGKMIEWKKETGNDVLFETTVDKTKFTFMINEKTVEKIAENYPENKKTTQKNIENYPEKLNDNQKTNITAEKTKKTTQKTTQKILILLSKNPDITTQQLSELVNITNDGIKWQLNKLKSQGIIRREGANKGGKWIIINKDND